MSVDKRILVIRDILYKVLDKYQDIYFVLLGAVLNSMGFVSKKNY